MWWLMLSINHSKWGHFLQIRYTYPKEENPEEVHNLHEDFSDTLLVIFFDHKWENEKNSCGLSGFMLFLHSVAVGLCKGSTS